MGHWVPGGAQSRSPSQIEGLSACVSLLPSAPQVTALLYATSPRKPSGWVGSFLGAPAITE